MCLLGDHRYILRKLTGNGITARVLRFIQRLCSIHQAQTKKRVIQRLYFRMFSPNTSCDLYAPAKFEVATSNGLEGYAFTRKHIV